jgi:SAM-dependent methyltransferase
VSEAPGPGYNARWGYRAIDARRYERRRYGSLVRRTTQRRLERTLLRALEPLPRGGLVLDIPCGTGILHDTLAARGLRVVAADISPAMLAVAQQRGRATGYVLADAERPPWRPGTFDAVVCARFLMLLPPPTRVAVLRTLAQLTRGPLVTTVCHPYTVKSFGRELRGLLGLPHRRSARLTRRELAAEVAASGLRLTALLAPAPLLSEVWVAVMQQ